MNFQTAEKYLDYVLVPSGLLVLGIYHCWLLIMIIRRPRRTVIGLNIASRHRWIYHMMGDQQKNGILAVQSLRNNLMASTVLASIAITLSSLISAVVSNTSSSSKSTSMGYTLREVKYFAVLICFLTAFFCNMQCTRYYAHVSLLVNVPCPEEKDEFTEYVAQKLNRGGLFWSIGLRAFYFAFPLLLWTFGPIPMFACSCLMALVLYFWDTTKSYSGYVRNGFVHEDHGNLDVESIVDSIESVRSGDSMLYCALLGSTKLGSTSDPNFLSPVS